MSSYLGGRHPHISTVDFAGESKEGGKTSRKNDGGQEVTSFAEVRKIHLNERDSEKGKLDDE